MTSLSFKDPSVVPILLGLFSQHFSTMLIYQLRKVRKKLRKARQKPNRKVRQKLKRNGLLADQLGKVRHKSN